MPSPGRWSLLFGVSCPTVHFCQAVGATFPDGVRPGPRTRPVVQLPLAERFDGVRWFVEPTASVGTGRFQDVSCPTTSFCVAVGQRGDSSALIETWNGRSWTNTPTGLPPGTGDLQGVSCPTPRSCVAVGSRGSATLIEDGSGGQWHVMSSPNGPTTSWSTLSGVSCSRATACLAVGSYDVSKAVGTVPFSVASHGTAWSVVPIQRPSSGELKAVACRTSRSCVAVGVTFQAPDGANLVETTAASGLVPAPAHDPAATQPGLAGVSCPAPARCVAVGSHYAGSGRYLTTIETSHDDAWSTVPSPNVIGA
jgi:hypothetical protein